MAPRSKNFTISVAGRSSRCKAFNLNILKLTSTCSWPSLIKITENFVLFLLKEVKVSIIYNGKRVRKAALIIGFAKYSISQIISLSFSFFHLLCLVLNVQICNSSDRIYLFLFQLLGLEKYPIPQIIYDLDYDMDLQGILFLRSYLSLFLFQLLGLIWYVQGSTEVDGKRLSTEGGRPKNWGKNKNSPKK